MPSPRGLPLAQKTGNGQRYLLPPKICSQFFVALISYRLWYGAFFISKFSMVVLFDRAKLMWKRRNIVIKMAMIPFSMKAN